MTRTLDFGGDKGAMRFELVYEAVLGGGATQRDPGERSRAIIRQEARILDALETVSEPDPRPAKTCETCGRPANADARQLAPAGGLITLSEDDHALIVKYVDVRPWLPRMARKVVDVQDWLSSAPKQE